MLDLEYTEIDGLLYPNIETGMENTENDLSKYGMMRLRYLHEHKREMYREMFLTGELAEHCRAIDKIAFEQSEQIQAACLYRLSRYSRNDCKSLISEQIAHFIRFCPRRRNSSAQ